MHFIFRLLFIFLLGLTSLVTNVCSEESLLKLTGKEIQLTVVKVTENSFRAEVQFSKLQKLPQYEAFAIENPDRLVVDVYAVGGAGLATKKKFNESSLAALRVGRHKDKVRFVFDVVKSKKLRLGSVSVAHDTVTISIPFTIGLQEAEVVKEAAEIAVSPSPSASVSASQAVSPSPSLAATPSPSAVALGVKDEQLVKNTVAAVDSAEKAGAIVPDQTVVEETLIDDIEEQPSSSPSTAPKNSIEQAADKIAAALNIQPDSSPKAEPSVAVISAGEFKPEDEATSEALEEVDDPELKKLLEEPVKTVQEKEKVVPKMVEAFKVTKDKIEVTEIKKIPGVSKLPKKSGAMYESELSAYSILEPESLKDTEATTDSIEQAEETSVAEERKLVPVVPEQVQPQERPDTWQMDFEVPPTDDSKGLFSGPVIEILFGLTLFSFILFVFFTFRKLRGVRVQAKADSTLYGAVTPDVIKDYYAILGCSENASAEEIKQRYKELAKNFHSDKLDSHDMPDQVRELATERFRKVQEAYEALKKIHKI